MCPCRNETFDIESVSGGKVTASRAPARCGNAYGRDRVSERTGRYRTRHHENTEYPINDAVTLVDLNVPLPPELRVAAEGLPAASRRSGPSRIYCGNTNPNPYLNQAPWPKIAFLLRHGSRVDLASRRRIGRARACDVHAADFRGLRPDSSCPGAGQEEAHCTFI